MESVLKKRIIFILKGGLGNQLFQYFHAMGLAEKFNASVYFDTYFGYRKDPFNRKLELNEIIKKKITKIKLLDFFLLVIFKIFKKNLIIKNVLKYFKISYITENRNFHFQNIKKISDINFFEGYWQSSKYFEKNKKKIFDSFNFRRLNDKKFLSVYRKIQKSPNPVLVGIRLYEETKNPNYYSLTSKIKKPESINKTITKINKKYNNCDFFIFSSKNNKFIKTLKFPVGKANFIFEEDGFNDSIKNLYLMKSCKHFIFMNSTYYWWAAWLSDNEKKFKNNTIFADRNFKNPNALCDNWIEF